jgi:hypothetical protein
MDAPRICTALYIEEPWSGKRWVELSPPFVEELTAWVNSLGARLEWQQIEPYGLIVELQEYRELMRQLADLVGAAHTPGALVTLEVLRAAVARLQEDGHDRV